MLTLTQADWVLIRLLAVANFARCVDPIFTDAYCNGEAYLVRKIGKRRLAQAMRDVSEEEPNSNLIYNKHSNITGYDRIISLYCEIKQRGDRKSVRSHDMKMANKWFANMQFAR